jgi:hypothetical protein
MRRGCWLRGPESRRNQDDGSERRHGGEDGGEDPPLEPHLVEFRVKLGNDRETQMRSLSWNPVGSPEGSEGSLEKRTAPGLVRAPLH